MRDTESIGKYLRLTTYNVMVIWQHHGHPKHFRDNELSDLHIMITKPYYIPTAAKNPEAISVMTDW
jgi:hypothetical protein